MRLEMRIEGDPADLKVACHRRIILDGNNFGSSAVFCLKGKKAFRVPNV
jgi:hypothetical protein